MIFLSAFGFATLTTASLPSDLDFWVGKWIVTADGKKAGDDTVEKWLDGVAVVEHWKDVDGGEGKSFFYYQAEQQRWKQVWVTSGGYKEKISEPYPNGIRFVGTVYLPTGRTYRDRTTLTRLKDGAVRQVIEATRDGIHWKVNFDAIYTPDKK